MSRYILADWISESSLGVDRPEKLQMLELIQWLVRIHDFLWLRIEVEKFKAKLTLLDALSNAIDKISCASINDITIWNFLISGWFSPLGSEQ